MSSWVPKNLSTLSLWNQPCFLFVTISLPKNTVRFQRLVSLSDWELFRDEFLLVTVTGIWKTRAKLLCTCIISCKTKNNHDSNNNVSLPSQSYNTIKHHLNRFKLSLLWIQIANNLLSKVLKRLQLLKNSEGIQELVITETII